MIPFLRANIRYSLFRHDTDDAYILIFETRHKCPQVPST